MAKSDLSKRNFRQRAHTNPFKDAGITVPKSPQAIDWSQYFNNGGEPTFADIGCGYGKFLMKVAQKHENHNILGIEIRDKVYEFVQKNIKAKEISNAGIMRTNALIFLPNIFKANQLDKIFILFPDPHFKKRKQKGRVICKQTLEVYYYIMKQSGRLYISTDVESLFNDMVSTIIEFGKFRALSEEEMSNDPLFEMTYQSTDEALRAGVKTGVTFGKVFEVQK